MLAITALTLVALIALGLYIAAALGVLGLFLDTAFSPFPLHTAMGEIVWSHSSDFILVTIPMFILMGEIILHSGIANRMYLATSHWLSWLPGGLMHANIGSSALFAATSGSSVATVATIGVAALPEQARYGYNERLFLGSIAAGGSLGILIPPSMNMIVFSALTNTSVPKLFVAGILPGLVLMLLFMAVIIGACMLRPHWGGTPTETRWAMRWQTLPDLVPPIALLAVVLGSIYAGWATPTEAASMGVIFALVLAAAHRRLTLAMLARVFEGTIRTSALITLILVFAFFLNFVIASVGLVRQVNDFIVGLGWTPLATMVLIVFIYIILGMFIEALPMVVLTVTVLAPIVEGMGYDLIWYGIIVVIVSEMAMLTPPIGMICYVIQGLRQKGALGDVFMGVAPFFAGIGVLLVLLFVFPELALWLPNVLFP